MKKIFALIFISSLILFAEENKFVSVNEKNIITPDGKPILLRGINLGTGLCQRDICLSLKNKFATTNQSNFSELLGPDETKNSGINFETIILQNLILPSSKKWD